MPATEITAPVRDPVTLAELKRHLRVTFEQDDAALRDYIAAAVDYCQRATGFQYITSTRRLDLAGFPGVIALDRAPLQAISSIKYLDTAGDLQTFDSSDYVADTLSRPAVVRLKYGSSWPETYSQHNAVQITYTAGFGDDPPDVPRHFRLAVTYLAGHWYLHREAVSGERSDKVAHTLGALLELESLPSF